MTALTQLARTVIGRAAFVGKIKIVAFAGPLTTATKGGVVVEGRWEVGACGVVGVTGEGWNGCCVVVGAWLSRNCSHSGDWVFRKNDPRHFIFKNSLWLLNRGAAPVIEKINGKRKRIAIFFGFFLFF